MYKSATLYICTNIFLYILEFALQNTGWFVKRFLGSVKNKKGYKFTTSYYHYGNGRVQYNNLY